MTSFITKSSNSYPVKIQINGIALNDSLQGVNREIRLRQMRLKQMMNFPCAHNILDRVSLQVQIGRLMIIKQELILVQTLKVHAL